MRRGSGNAAFQLFSFQDIITSVMGIAILILVVLALELSQRHLNSPVARHAAVRQDAGQSIEDVKAEIASIRNSLQSGLPAGLIGLLSTEIEEGLQNVELEIASLERMMRERQQRLKSLTAMLEKVQHEEMNLDLTSRVATLEQSINKLESATRQASGHRRILLRTEPSSAKIPWIVEISANAILIARHDFRGPPLVLDQLDQAARDEVVFEWLRSRNPDQNYLHILLKRGAVDSFQKIYAAARERGFQLGFDLLSENDSAIDPQWGASLSDPLESD